MGILGALHRAGPQRVTELATRTGMVTTLVSREIRGLDQAGLVRRTADGSDGRAVVVVLTPSGRAAYERLRRTSVEAAGEALAHWRADELVDLARVLGRVADDFAAAPR
jgi:DNA-binding MarR family transcriptional regulator